MTTQRHVYAQWVVLVVILLIQLFGTNNHADNHPSVDAPAATASRAMMRSLQQTNGPAEGPAVTVTPLADENDVAVAPAPAPTPTPTPLPERASPAPEQASPLPAPVDAVDVPIAPTTPAATCDCPPPPPPALPPALAFLEDVFTWDADRNALIINAKTIDAAGHLIVNGFSGIRQSLFVGGDPNNGESATEISPGGLLLYKAGEDAYPTLAGFQTGPSGYDMSAIEVMGGLQILDAKGEVTVV